jgi:hypothetical protein
MMDHVVLLKWHVMLGCDIHNEITATWPPLPAPNVPHIVGMRLAGLSGQASLTGDDVVANGWNIVQRDSDISAFIPHIPIPPFPPIILLALIIPTSGSKSYFGPSTVIANKKPIAGALLGPINLQLNCADPCPLPCGIVIAWGSVVCGMTWGDIIGGFIGMAIDAAMSFAINKVAGLFGMRAEDKMLKDLIGTYAGIAISQLLGSPIGYSFSVPGHVAGDDANPGNWGSNAGHAAGNAIDKANNSTSNDPHTEQH